MAPKILVHRVAGKEIVFVEDGKGGQDMLMEYCPYCRKKTPVWVRGQDDTVGQNMKVNLMSSFFFGSRSKETPGSNWYCSQCQYHHPPKKSGDKI